MTRSRRGRVPSWFLVLLIVTAISVALWAHYRGIGRKAPDSASDGVVAAPAGKGLFDMAFTATTLDGETFSTADHRGHVVLVNCFATWCPPCRVETPHLVKLYNERHEDGLDVVMVSDEPAEKLRPFVQTYDIPYPVIPDGRHVTAMVPNLRGIPTTVILDRQGAVRHRITGAHVDEIVAAVGRLLEE